MMTYTYKTFSDHLLVDIEGEYTFKAYNDFLLSLGEQTEEKILVDARKLKKTDFSYSERYQLGMLAGEVLNKNLKYAFIWPENDINYFGVTVAAKQGINIQIFASASKTKKWLLSNNILLGIF